ncbi:MAG: glycosyltransferase [Gaiellaceae bacterium MAG52_C11]|nr:glycosyltransferase [Candidatus Gaiellasilicea maunaloa]
MTPELTVIVPTRDRPEALARCLAALGAQHGRPWETLVVDDGSHDRARIAELVAAEPRARLLRRDGDGPAAARNAAVREARGTYVCFTDDDCEPAPDWAESLAGRLEAGATIVGGTTLNGRPESSYVTAAERIRRHLEEFTRARHPGRGFFATNNLACRRELALELRFDEAYGAGGEDRDWCARAASAGHELVFEPVAVVRHLPALDLRGFWRQQVRYGRGAYRFHRSRPRGEREHRQPASFYLLLVRGGFRDGFRPGLLVVFSQVATAVGLLREAWSDRGGA